MLTASYSYRLPVTEWSEVVRPFLLPSDAQVSNDVDLLEQTAVNVAQMKERIRKTGVGAGGVGARCLS